MRLQKLPRVFLLEEDLCIIGAVPNTGRALVKRGARIAQPEKRGKRIVSLNGRLGFSL